jgi:DNA repair protein RecN (Recombination protein N)
MLQHLSIQNYTIISELNLEFDSGMTVLTGETGAGKSIIIDALLLALGHRADVQIITADCDRCVVTASFAIHKNSIVQQWLVEHELNNQDECILRRTITRDGRSRAFINDQAISLQLLRECGELLVSIHGQHAHQTLLKTDQQRDLLDAYAENDDLVAQVQTIYFSWRETQQVYEELKSKNDQRQSRLDFLNYQIAELSKLNLQKDELTQLDQDQKRLANAENLLSESHTALDLLNENEDGAILPWLNKVQNVLLAKQEIDVRLKNAADCVSNAIIQIEEAINELTHYCDQVDLDPERLNQVEQRLSLLHDAARKHKVAPEQLLNCYEQLQQELAQLTHSDEYLLELENKIKKLADDYQVAAQKLSASRKKAATKLATAVEKYLQQLNMSGGKFKIDIQALTEANLHRHGLEKIEFLVSTNPGQALQALNKVVSGGELSRISLAIHVLTAQSTATPTLIFDEVDVGIGGSTAEIVGRLLRQLANNAQVFCVTHLPQVAALGQQHFQVSKTVKNNKTSTAIKLLDQTNRIQEIARMLGGVKITDQTLAHAKEMVEVVT